MSGTNKNPYPLCIKCNAELNPSSGDAKRWEKIDIKQSYNEYGDTIIWLCPECISKFQHTQDLKNKTTRVLADFKYLLDEADNSDAPNE